MEKFGHRHVVETDDQSAAVGCRYQNNGETRYAPRGLADSVAKLVAGNSHLTDAERRSCDCAGISVVASSDGSTRSLNKLSDVVWFGLPTAPKAPERPVATVTLLHRPYKR